MQLVHQSRDQHPCVLPPSALPGACVGDSFNEVLVASYIVIET